MRKRSLLLATGACLATVILTMGAALADPTPTPTTAVPSSVFSVFPLATKAETRAGSLPAQVTVGPDHAVWFTELVGDKIGRIIPDGQVREFSIPATSANTSIGPFGITTGPDGNIWFTEEIANKIGRLTPSGALTEFPLPSSPTGGSLFPTHMKVGPDGNLWFSEAGGHQIVRMLPHTPYTMTAFPTTPANASPGDFTTGPDGNLWFTMSSDGHGGSQIARMNTHTDTITYFDYNPDAEQSYSGIEGITVGPDKNLWVAGGGANTIVTLSPVGSDAAIQASIHDFDLKTPHSIPRQITTDPDGNLWFTEFGITRSVARMTTSGSITEFPLPTENCPASDFFALPGFGCEPYGLTLGPDGRLWIVEFGGNAMARMDLAIRVVTGAVHGPVTIAPGETVLIRNATIDGPVTAEGSSGVFICGSTVRSGVSVHASTGFGFIGDVGPFGDEWLDCAPNTITGSVSILGNQGGFALGGNHITGGLTVLNNLDGRLTSSDSPADVGLEIEGNSITGPLICLANTPVAPVNDGHPNTVIGPRIGQCAGL